MTNTDPKLKSVIVAAFERALNSVGILTLLFTISVYGLAMLVFDWATSIKIAVAVLGAVGFCEIFHRQALIKLDGRRKPSRDLNAVLTFLREKQRTRTPQVLKELNYGGLNFKAIGFDQLKMPVGISSPLCPDCGSVVAETVGIRFPGRIEICFQCGCGFRKKSKITKAEIMETVAELFNTPQ